MEDPAKDQKTSEQSNSGESDAQPDKIETTQVESDAGQAADDKSTDKAPEAPEGDKSRGERRHERYIDKLSAEIQASTDQDSRFTDELFKPADYKPLEFKDGAEYDPADLEKDREAATNTSFARGVQQGLNQGSTQAAKLRWADHFEIDSDRVTAKYPSLDVENTETYDPQLEATLVQKYVQFTGVTKDDKGRIAIERPNVRFKDFVEAEMRNLEEYATRHASTASKNIASQASKTGVRPTGQTRPTKGDHGFDPADPVNSVHRMTSKQYFELGGKEASDAYLADRGLAPKT